jgi:ABC-type bacteriocin/lantibiotic exporter with double-glycine peptidase domain
VILSYFFTRGIAWVPRGLRISLFVLPLIFSCAGAPDVTELGALRIIEKVPFYPQEAYQCGPASLAGILNYWRVAVSPEDIAVKIYSESAGGTLDMDMVLYAQQQGLQVEQYEGSIEDIRRNIDLGYPIIVLVDYGFWVYQQNHFMVVVGYNENGILANSGSEQLKFISFKDFLNSWKKTDFWTMLVKPIK